MISRHLNQSSTSGSGKFFLTLGMAFLVLTGEILAQDNQEKDRQTQKKASTLFSALRFKNKQETVQPPKVDSSTKETNAPRKTNIETPPVVPAASHPVTAEKVEKVSSAPLPPEDNYFEKASQLSEEKKKKDNSLSIMPESFSGPDTTPLLMAQRDLATATQPEEPTVASLSSYSFDTRDWVEYFPVGHMPESFSSNQSTTLPDKVLPDKNADHPLQRPGPSATIPPQSAGTHAIGTEATASNDWNGTAMPIQEQDRVEIRLASIKQSFPDVSKELDMEFSGVDLTASYASRLKYSEICGVVVVQSNFPLTEIKSILEEIKLLQRDLNLYMGVPAPKEKIELCLFRDENSYLKFLREVFPKAPRDRRALYIKLDGKPGTLLVQKTEEFDVDLRHEMTHAIIHASIRDVPIWLDEGLAKYFEVPIKDRAADNPYMKQIRWNTRFGAVPMLNRLEKLEHIGQMGAREYRDSWAWVHFMVHHSPQTHRLLAGYLQLLATLPEQAAIGDKSGSSVRIPPLSLYLNDELDNPRESYREHFQSSDE